MADWTDEEYSNILGLHEEISKSREMIQKAKEIIHMDSMKPYNKNHEISKYPDRPDHFEHFSFEDRDEIQDFHRVLSELPSERQNHQKNKKITRPPLKKKGKYLESNWADSEPSVISIVKDQGRNCSASHAFAVIAALEAA